MKYFQWNLSYGPLFVPANKWNDSSGYFSVILLKALWLLLSELLLSTAKPHHISGQVLSSHSIVLLSRAVRPCSPWGGRWIEKWRTTWSTVCSSAPHSYAAEGTITHVSKQERQRPRAVRRRLRRTHSVLVRVIQESGCQCREWKYGVTYCSPTIPHSIAVIRPERRIFCCYCQMNWWVHVRRGQMGVSIWDAVHSHSVYRWGLSGAAVQASWHGVISSCNCMCLCILCYCDTRLKSRALHVGVKTLHNTHTHVGKFGLHILCVISASSALSLSRRCICNCFGKSELSRNTILNMGSGRKVCKKWWDSFWT